MKTYYDSYTVIDCGRTWSYRRSTWNNGEWTVEWLTQPTNWASECKPA